jgi:hypothetical protein
MPIHCDVILRWDATPGQLRVLGAALWRWCSHPGRDGGLYQHLDNQALADLIAGKFPAPGPTRRQAGRVIHFSLRDERSRDRQAVVDGLRRELPAEGVADVLVNGTSWSPAA